MKTTVTGTSMCQGYAVTWGQVVEPEWARCSEPVVVQLAGGDTRVRLGQTVIANGRVGAPAGTPCLIVELHAPFTNGRSTDIVDCLCKVDGRVRIVSLKLKDII